MKIVSLSVILALAFSSVAVADNSQPISRAGGAASAIKMNTNKKEDVEKMARPDLAKVQTGEQAAAEKKHKVFASQSGGAAGNIAIRNQEEGHDEDEKHEHEEKH